MTYFMPDEKNANEMLISFMEGVTKRNPGEPEFHQAVHEFAANIFPFIEDKPIYQEMRIMERLVEPDRAIYFRVPWTDDAGNIRVNRGFRVQFNNSIGPYKGGIRFHPNVNMSVLKFLGFEQIFKNSLTGLPMGGGKGGANFNPKGKSDNEIMRFCQSFITELYRHIGSYTDVPAGDIGVGAREIGFMFGQYKRITNQFSGVLTGKGLQYGGSKLRTEATGYGAAIFLNEMMKESGRFIEGKRISISGAGNVATYAAEKILQLGAKPITLSDSSGFIHDPEGITQEKLEWVKELKQERRGQINEYVKEYPTATFHEGRPWNVPTDIAMPCATQNELSLDDANTLIKNGIIAISEGANMPCELDAVNAFKQANVLLGPAKAANAGGVGISGLEMSQNSTRVSWSNEKVEQHLNQMMERIHAQCVEHGRSENGVDYVKGANIAGFIKVADAMLAYGHV